MSEAYEVVCDSSDREAWLRARREMLGASDVPAVLGLSPWTPAIDVWALKTSKYEEAPDDVTEPMELGTALEPWLLNHLSKKSGCVVKPEGKLLRSKRWPHLGATLDGSIEGKSGTPLAAFAGVIGVVEVKSAGGAFADDWVNPSDDSAGLIPAHYAPQVLTQLAVTGAPFAVFGVLMGGRGFRFRWCVKKRVEAEIVEMAERTGEWWARHVIADSPPEPDGSERAADLIARLYPEQGGIVPLGDEAAEYVDHLLGIKADLKAREQQKNQLDQALRLAIGGASIGELPDGRQVKLATIKRKGFTVEPSEYRRLMLPKEMAR